MAQAQTTTDAQVFDFHLGPISQLVFDEYTSTRNIVDTYYTSPTRPSPVFEIYLTILKSTSTNRDIKPKKGSYLICSTVEGEEFYKNYDLYGFTLLGINDIDMLNSNLRSIDVTTYGLPSTLKIWIDEDSQTVLFTNECDYSLHYDVPRILSVFHKIAPWIDADLLKSRKYKNSSLAKVVSSYAKRLYQAKKYDDSIFDVAQTEGLVYEFDSYINKYNQRDLLKEFIEDSVKNSEDNELKSINEWICRVKNNIEDLYIKINSEIKKLNDLKEEYKYHKYLKEQNYDKDAYETIMSIFNNDNINILKVTKDTVTFQVKCLLEYFDPEDFEDAFKYLSKTTKTYRDDEVFCELINQIKERKIKLKLFSALYFDKKSFNITIANGSYSSDLLLFPSEAPNYIPNTHLMEYSCVGNKGTDILKYSKDKDFERLLMTYCGLTANINAADSTVFPDFIRSVYDAYSSGKFGCVFEKNGESYCGFEIKNIIRLEMDLK